MGRRRTIDIQRWKAETSEPGGSVFRSDKGRPVFLQILARLRSWTLIAALTLSACATLGSQADPKGLAKLAQTTSCDVPLILRVAEARPIGAEADAPVDTGVINPETGEPFVLTRAQIWEASASVKVAALGYGDAMPKKADVQCPQADVMRYTLPDAARLAYAKNDNAKTFDAEPSTEPAPSLHVRYMTSAQIQVDPNVRCAPTYQQIYQPPLTLGGSGRVMQVANGERCEVDSGFSGVFKKRILIALFEDKRGLRRCYRESRHAQASRNSGLKNA